MKAFLFLHAIIIVLSADIKVYVSHESEIQTVTKQELKNLYLKKIKSLHGKKVTVYDNEQNYDEFNKKFINKTPNQIHAYWMKQIFLGKRTPPKKLNADLIHQLKQDPNCIYYSSQNLDAKVIYHD